MFPGESYPQTARRGVMTVSQDQYNFTKDRVKTAEGIINPEGISDETADAMVGPRK